LVVAIIVIFGQIKGKSVLIEEQAPFVEIFSGSCPIAVALDYLYPTKMEYDNDRLRKRTPRMEVFYWVLLALLSPVTDCITILPNDKPGWIMALLLSGAAFPLYLIYAHLMGTLFLVRERKLSSVLMSLLSFLVIEVFVFTLYSLVLKLHLSPTERSYLSFTIPTVIRVSWWVAINMSLSIAIFLIRKGIDEKSLLLDVKKESSFFQLRYLRAQLNPHFLFNTLNSIYSLSLQKSDRAPEVVVRLADIMRYLIYECDEETILLDKEIEFIRNYIEIEKIRHSADIRLTVEGPTAGIRIEPFLFISFIENGFKHAMDHSFGEPFIYITVKTGNGQLTLNVINSMEADLETQAKRINGKGIAHSRSLLELLYPSAYDLDIIQTQKDESRTSQLRLRNARERLESLYPDSHTLDVILNKSSFTVSLILKTVNVC
jgi:two-component system LytT family sensor kinase